jgi:translation initiation factor 4G
VGDGWEVVGKGKGSGGGSGSGSGGGKSALSGPYVASKHGDRAMPTEREKAKLDAAAGEDGGASSSGGGTLNAEKIDAVIDSMIDEYTNVGDVKEAVLCVKEIQKEAKDSAAAITSCASKLVSHVVDLSQEKARDLVIALLAAMVHDCDVPDVVISTALGEPVMALDDIAIDVPMAPKLLGVMTARLVSANALDAAFIKTSAQEIEDVLYRREFAAAAFKELNAEGAKGAKATVDAAGIDVAKLLGGDPEFDSPIGEFLEKQGLKELC